jgi:hypothetical protein
MTTKKTMDKNEPITHPIGFIDTIAPPKIDLHATYRISYEIGRIYLDDEGFRKHIEDDLAHQMAAIIKEKMDVFWRDLGNGDKEVEASVRVLNIAEWRDLESQLFKPYFLHQQENYTNAWLLKQKLSLIPYGSILKTNPIVSLHSN